MVQKSAAKIRIVAAQNLAALASAEVRNRCGLTATPTVESAVILITRASSLSAIGVPFIIHDYFGLMVGAGAGYSLVDSRIRDFCKRSGRFPDTELLDRISRRAGHRPASAPSRAMRG